MRKLVRATALFGLVALAGCDLATDPGLVPIQEAEVAELAGAAADAARGEGLSLESLLRRMHEAIRASGGNAKAQELLDASTALAKQSRDAAVAGDKTRAQTLATQSQAKLLEAVVLVLGPGVARDAVTTARAVLTDLKAKLAGKALPEKMAAQLAAAERRLAEAETALAQGKSVDALSIALAVDGEVRALAGQDPIADAAKAVEEAAAWLNRARTVAGSSPSAEVAAALVKAQQLLTQAQDALKAGDRTSALKLATESSAISRKIYESLSLPPDPGKPTTDAARAIEEASSWLNRARTVAGPSPSAEIASLLAKAAQLLEEAQKALKAGDSAAAVKLAAESTAISRKVAAPTPPPPEVGKVLEEAAAWLARAKTAIGPTPTADAAARLAKAAQLLEEAQKALKAGNAASALALANQSIEISRTLVPTDRD